MQIVPVIVDSRLRVDGNIIGASLVEAIFDELTIPNEEKAYAERTQRWGWQELPDEFQLGKLIGDTVVMPRGYAYQLKTLLRDHGMKVKWVDRRHWRRGSELGNGDFPYRPHQAEAVRQIIRNQQGIYEAPTGSGKTVTCIGFIKDKRPRKTLILVDKIDLLNQWRQQLALWLLTNIDDIGIIGGGKWVEGKRITVATVQTLWSKFKDEQDPEAIKE